MAKTTRTLSRGRPSPKLKDQKAPLKPGEKPGRKPLPQSGKKR